MKNLRTQTGLRVGLLVLMLMLCSSWSALAAPATFSTPMATVFINELHYDNDGGDTGEAVEIAGPAGTDLSGWSLALYNGNGGTVYGTISLSGIIPDQANGFGTLDFLQAGLQNGSPDGIALVDNTNAVIQFLSYEGTFVATSGPANGLTSTDIGVSEGTGTPAGFSLQLSGNGSVYDDFTWSDPQSETFGEVNVEQTFTSAPPTPTPTDTPAPIPATPTPTDTPTPMPPTDTPTPIPPTPTDTVTPTPVPLTPTPTVTVTPTPVPPTPTNTATSTPLPPTPTPTNAITPTPVPSCDIILDNFDRHAFRLGNNWRGSIWQGNYALVNEAQVEVMSGGAAYWKEPPFGTDQEACLTLTKIDSRGHHSVLLKVQPTNNGAPRWKKGAIAVFYSTEGPNRVGVETYLPGQGWATIFSTNTTLSSGDVLGGRALADGTVEVLVNNVVVGSTDAPYFAGKNGHIGVWFIGYRHATFDDFVGSNISP